jgi:glycoside/pentoside/hexuronide:cation symporter, GPH family
MENPQDMETEKRKPNPAELDIDYTTPAPPNRKKSFFANFVILRIVLFHLDKFEENTDKTTGKLFLNSKGQQREPVGLSTLNILAYAVGHVYNDMWATVWFMYLLYFITFTVEFGPGLASLALLSGQIADGISTNLVGFFIDKTKTRIGKRTPWFLFGTLLVIPCFLLTFNTWTGCQLLWGEEQGVKWKNGNNMVIVYIYYITLPALFNIGWAAVQISTMSIIVSITYDQKQRDNLISYRNAFTFGSNLATLGIALLLFKYEPDAVWQFRYLGLIITGIGILSGIFYLYGVPEVKLSTLAITKGIQYSSWSVESRGNTVEHWKEWLTIKQFYWYGLVYALARMSINVTMTLTPFYLIIVLLFQRRELEPTPPEIASVPLVSYTSSMIFTLLYTHKFNKYFNEYNRLSTLMYGSILVIISSVPFLFMQANVHWLIYIFVPIQGIGLAIGLNVSSSLISDMLGRNNKNSSFVYGMYSLADKFSSGILLVIIGRTVIENEHWLRILTGILPIVTSFWAWFFAFMGQEEGFIELHDL